MSVSLLRIKSPEIIPALLRCVVEDREKNPDSRLAVGGDKSWASVKRSSMSKELYDEFQKGLQKVTGTRSWGLTVWASVVDPGGAIQLHNHADTDGDNVWSGILYLTGGSAIVFPEIGYRFLPEPGALLIFPAATFHSVELAECTRVAIAFNARRTDA